VRAATTHGRPDARYARPGVLLATGAGAARVGTLPGMDTRPPPRLDEQLRDELTELTTSVCKALNDPKRLMILYALRDGPLTVSELVELLDASQANVSQHLAILRERGIVEPDRQGNNVYYSLRHPQVLEAVDLLRDILSAELGRRAGVVSA
jgi:DNA-binding transcriptional ArsR family regulator